jgi:hypothetical protein
MSCQAEARLERNESRAGNTVDQKHDHYPDALIAHGQMK